MTDSDDNELHDNVDKNVEWLGVKHHKNFQNNKPTEIERDDNLVMLEDNDVAPSSESDFEIVNEHDNEKPVVNVQSSTLKILTIQN